MKKKLTRKQQLAVDIAKDIIKWIGEKKLRIKDGLTYLSGSLPNCEIRSEDQVQPHLPLLRKNCDVCAKGAIFLSYIELKNKITFDSLDFVGVGFSKSVDASEETICDLLGGAFSKENLDLIESAFEKHRGFYGEEKRAYDFGRKYRSPRKRMIAICENIIKNKGEFKP